MTARPLAALTLAAGLALGAQPAAAATHSYRGKLEIRHADDFRHGRSATDYTLVAGGRRTPLALARTPRITSGSSVLVRGRASGRVVTGSVRPLRTLLRAAGVTPGARKTAVILVKFDASTPPWTPDHVRQRIFTDSTSTNAYYKEDSYGDISLVGKNRTDGDVYGWYTISPVGTGPYGCDVDAIASEAQSAAAADGFSASGYQHIIYVFPQLSSCGSWAGLGDMPGTESWMNGYIGPAVVAHELGHNMGLNHANTFSCTNAGTAVAISANCTSNEYGDPYDVMGEDSYHNNAFHLFEIGFLHGANVQTVSANGTYTINSTASRGGIQLLRIPRPGSSRDYDLSLRSPGGVFDDFAATDPIAQGVSIHTDPDVLPGDPTQSLLIDTTPGSPGGFDDAALAPGHSFRDGDISITTVSVIGGVATVQVNVTPGAPADTTAPSAPDPVTATPAADHVTLAWPAATDDVGVAGYRIYRDGSLVQTTTATLWVDTSVLPGGTYSYRVEAYDAAGNSADSTPVTATVPSPPPPVDKTAPIVRIGAPASGARVRRSTVVRASATDRSGVKRIELWIDGKLRSHVAAARAAWTWSLRGVSRGTHRIAVHALDPSGNVGRATIRVRVVR